MNANECCQILDMHIQEQKLKFIMNLPVEKSRMKLASKIKKIIQMSTAI
jgi:hypothetical protein